MASRYENNQTKKTNDGRTVYRSKVYPTIPLRDSDIYVATETGDRLDTLANQYYNDSSLWWIISSANSDLPQNSYYIPEGRQIRIPQNIGSVISQFKALNER